MAGKLIVPSACTCGVVLDIGRAYSGEEAARFLGITVFVLNQRVREGKIKPVFDTGDRRYSGYVIARLLDWPLSDDPRDYMPSTPGGRRHVSNRRAREEAREAAREEALVAEQQPKSHTGRGSYAESLARTREGKLGVSAGPPVRPAAPSRKATSHSGWGSFAGSV